MKRQKDKNEGEIRWKKNGGGTFRDSRGNIIKPNQVFYSRPEDIPQSFRDQITPIDTVPGETAEKQIPKGSEPEYILERTTPKSNYYNILDANNKKQVSEKAITKKQAEKMVNDLGGVVVSTIIKGQDDENKHGLVEKTNDAESMDDLIELIKENEEFFEFVDDLGDESFDKLKEMEFDVLQDKMLEMLEEE
jgi:hypothetical protein